MITTNEEYEATLILLEILMNQKPPDSNTELENLSILIEDWEKIHYPISEPSFLSMVEFRFSQKFPKVYKFLQ